MTKDDIISESVPIFEKYGWCLTRDEYVNKPDHVPKNKIYKLFANWNEFVSECKKYTTSYNYTKAHEDKYTETFTYNTGTLESKSTRITSLDEAIAHFNVDLAIWDVDKHIVNSWEVATKNSDGEPVITVLYQVKVWLKRKIIDHAKDAIISIIESARDYMPDYSTFNANYKYYKYNSSNSPCIVEIAIMDVHLANLAWGKEVGYDYDSKIASKDYIDTVAQLVSYCNGLNIEKFVLPHGNDFLHVDNLFNTTTAGTHQDVDTRWHMAFQTATKITVDAIDNILSPIAPVDILMIPGNHDTERVFYLGEVLKSWYRKSSHVSVNNDPSPRKYYNYGVNLIGFTHGNKEKMDSLPLIMATEVPDKWAASSIREFHIGHRHRKGETRFIAGDTFNGVYVRTIPSLCSADAWHHSKGFVHGRRAGEAYVYDKVNGYRGHFSGNIIY